MLLVCWSLLNWPRQWTNQWKCINLGRYEWLRDHGSRWESVYFNNIFHNFLNTQKFPHSVEWMLKRQDLGEMNIAWYCLECQILCKWSKLTHVTGINVYFVKGKYFTLWEGLGRQTWDKPIRIIIKLLFGFASDLSNSTNHQISNSEKACNAI